ncbi:MAG: hypothetical protein WC968_03105 [Bacilli bacterium]
MPGDQPIINGKACENPGTIVKVVFVALNGHNGHYSVMKYKFVKKIVKLFIASFFIFGSNISCSKQSFQVSLYIDIPANMAQSEVVRSYLHGIDYLLSDNKTLNFSFEYYNRYHLLKQDLNQEKIDIVIASHEFDKYGLTPVISPYFKPLDVSYDTEAPLFPMSPGMKNDVKELIQLVEETGVSRPLILYSDEPMIEAIVADVITYQTLLYSPIKIEQDTQNYEGVYKYISNLETDAFILLLNPHDFISLYYHLVYKGNETPVYLPSFVARYHPEVLRDHLPFPLTYFKTASLINDELSLETVLKASSYFNSLNVSEQSMIIRHKDFFNEGYAVGTLIREVLNNVSSMNHKPNEDVIKKLHALYKTIPFSFEAYNK